jgi:hypothetical protein
VRCSHGVRNEPLNGPTKRGLSEKRIIEVARSERGNKINNNSERVVASVTRCYRFSYPQQKCALLVSRYGKERPAGQRKLQNWWLLIPSYNAELLCCPC